MNMQIENGYFRIIDFYKWFKEIDIRRDTNLLETFPEMEQFMALCKETAQGEIPLENIG